MRDKWRYIKFIFLVENSRWKKVPFSVVSWNHICDILEDDLLGGKDNKKITVTSTQTETMFFNEDGDHCTAV